MAGSPRSLGLHEQLDPIATTRLGISLRGLRQLEELLVEGFGWERFKAMTTRDVTKEWVLEVTKERRCRLLELPGLVDAADVGPPLYFISHACALLECAGGKPEGPRGRYLDGAK
jgi:hypothetical protein